jgi:hypothetical protein
MNITINNTKYYVSQDNPYDYGWSCCDENYDGAPDSNCIIGHGDTAIDAVVDLLSYQVEHDDDIYQNFDEIVRQLRLGITNIKIA